MADKFNPKSFGTTVSIAEDRDWNPRMDDVEITSRDLNNGWTGIRERNQVDPVTELKNRLSRWGIIPTLIMFNCANFIQIPKRYQNRQSL